MIVTAFFCALFVIAAMACSIALFYSYSDENPAIAWSMFVLNIIISLVFLIGLIKYFFKKWNHEYGKVDRYFLAIGVTALCCIGNAVAAQYLLKCEDVSTWVFGGYFALMTAGFFSALVLMYTYYYKGSLSGKSDSHQRSQFHEDRENKKRARKNRKLKQDIERKNLEKETRDLINRQNKLNQENKPSFSSEYTDMSSDAELKDRFHRLTSSSHEDTEHEELMKILNDSPKIPSRSRSSKVLERS